MHRNQQEAIRVEQENNAKLETVNTKAAAGKTGGRGSFSGGTGSEQVKEQFPCQYVPRYPYSDECDHWYYVIDPI